MVNVETEPEKSKIMKDNPKRAKDVVHEFT